MNQTRQTYRSAFQRLHTDKNRTRWTPATSHRAPHKMLLLLSVIDLVEEAEITTAFVEITPLLLDTFASYWSAIMPPEKRGDIWKPFFHLRYEGFWHPVPKPGKDTVYQSMGSCHSLRQFQETFAGARLNRDLYELLRHQSARDMLRATLLGTYFSESLQISLQEVIQRHRDAFAYSQELFEFARHHEVAESPPPGFPSDETPVRDQGFRRAVVTAYEHRCALCGIRMLTPQGHTAVDAAHIVPWSESHCDDVRNGLSLCRLCHWVFDECLITVSARYRILTSPLLQARSNLPGHLLQLQRREIITPAERAFFPAQRYLEHHRKRFRTVR